MAPARVGDYLNDHPVGDNAIVGCTGQYNWDCTIAANGTILMNGPNSSQFVQNYGFFVSTQAYNNQPTVQCTTCHNQHLMNVVKVTNGANSGLPSGNYATMFFIRAPYNPASGTGGSNQTAQFCRQCHGGEGQRVERRLHHSDDLLTCQCLGEREISLPNLQGETRVRKMKYKLSNLRSWSLSALRHVRLR